MPTFEAKREPEGPLLATHRGQISQRRRGPTGFRVSRLLPSLLLFTAGVIFGALLIRFELGVGLLSSPLRFGSQPPTPTLSSTPPKLDVDQVVPAGSSNSSIGQLSLLWGGGSRHPTQHVKATADESSPYERSLVLMEGYARKHGYPLWIGRHAFLEGPQKGKKTGMWTKQALVMSVMLNELRKPEGQRLSWLFYLDADSAILNPNVPLETFLPPDTDFGRNQTLLASLDQWGTMNAGAFLIRVSQDGLRILSTILAHPFLRDNVHGHWGNGEQTSTAWIFGNKHFLDKVALVPAHWFNADALHLTNLRASFRQIYKPGDLLMHFMTGVKTGWEDYLTQAEQRNSTLMPPLNQTRYVKGEETVGQWWKSWEAKPREERHKILIKGSQRQD